MTIDPGASAAFDLDIQETPPRAPSDLELGRAMDAIAVASPRPLPEPLRPEARVVLQDLVPACALAAACLIAALSGRPGTMLPRPLAVELATTLPDDTGGRFVSFVISVGDSLRSEGR